MSYYIVIRWDTIQNGWILIVVMTVIYKCEDVDNLICLKTGNSPNFFFLTEIEKCHIFSGSVTIFFSLNLLVKTREVTTLLFLSTSNKQNQ
jgi:hypothetical protein